MAKESESEGGKEIDRRKRWSLGVWVVKETEK